MSVCLSVSQVSLITMVTLSVFTISLLSQTVSPDESSPHQMTNHFSISQTTGFKFLMVCFVTRFPDVARLEANIENEILSANSQYYLHALSLNAWDECSMWGFSVSPHLDYIRKKQNNWYERLKNPSALLQRNEQSSTGWCVSEQSSGAFSWSCDDVTSTGTRLHRLQWDWLFIFPAAVLQAWCESVI